MQRCRHKPDYFFLENRTKAKNKSDKTTQCKIVTLRQEAQQYDTLSHFLTVIDRKKCHKSIV